MKFQFSFNEKREMIFIDEAPVELKIGSLIRSIIDTDWSTVQKKIGRLPDEAFWGDADGEFLLKKNLSELIDHPGLVYHVAKCSSRESFYALVDQLVDAQKTTLLIMEALVDEEKHTYTEVLFDLLYLKDPNVLSQCILQTEDAFLLPITERVMPVYTAANDYSFLFETNDIKTILFQEIQYLCTNHFIVRKCAYCRKFFWTRKMNCVYCNRKVEGTEQTCSRLGPARVCNKSRPKAYQKYWRARAKLYKRQVTTEDEAGFKLWLKRTEPYRELAKRDAISEEDMTAVLNKIEEEIYSSPVSVGAGRQ